MKFVADLHIHSHFSIATSGQLRPEYLDHWGRIKGVRVIGTGDFTHPGWLAELKESLEPAEPGLYRLKASLKLNTGWTIPETSENSVRFLLSAEISNIYKKSGKVRKVHNVLLAPDFVTAEKIQSRLSALNFNITSDGRPILGLDSRDLLELALDASPDVFLIPAHVWTPWFSALGARSGFDSIEDCYGDLSGHISAVETGLSSDPPMNWLVSGLDRYTLVSNSDAHSPEKLGREANLFDTEFSYAAITQAVRSGDPDRFLGTVEFFPQEGKYHHDGHRKCGVSWAPEETARHDGLCPVCGRPVVEGVLGRVLRLADRTDPDERPNRHSFRSTIPLAEILSEIHGVGAKSKQIVREYAALLDKLGPELYILLDTTPENLRRAGGELLQEAVLRMREGRVHITAGFDGEYGVIRAFAPGEIRRLSQASLFQESSEEKKRPCPDEGEAVSVPGGRKAEPVPPAAAPDGPGRSETLAEILDRMNPGQRNAVLHYTGPAMILAGPGTGKTRVLTARIARLVREGVAPTEILALTFTQKAAREMAERVFRLIPDLAHHNRPAIHTFHALGHAVLREQAHLLGRTDRFTVADEADRRSLLSGLGYPNPEIKALSRRIAETKQHPDGPADPGDEAFGTFLGQYEGLLRKHDLFDLDDLVSKPVRLFRSHPGVLHAIRDRFRWILVDEYQDVNSAQYRLIRLLMPVPESNLFVIGDPDQAIYGFRGADASHIRRFQEDYPDARVYRLPLSYRCTETILSASRRVLGGGSLKSETLKGLNRGLRIRIRHEATDKSEAEFIARRIEEKMGGLRFFSMDSAVATGYETADLSLSDFAVLCRTGRQTAAIEKAFQDHGIPFQTAGERPFFDQEPVRSLVALFRALCRAGDGPLTRPVADRYGIPESERADWVSRVGRESVPALFRDLIARGSVPIPENAQPAVRRLLDLAGEFGEDAEKFLLSTAIGTGQDTLRPDTESVSVLTLHASKGLEFECVFIAGCEEGLIPYRLFGRESDPEEERRLLYVGMTRARSELILTHAGKRFLRGQPVRLPRSAFLDDIEEALAAFESAGKRRSRRRGDGQLGLFGAERPGGNAKRK